MKEIILPATIVFTCLMLVAPVFAITFPEEPSRIRVIQTDMPRRLILDFETVYTNGDCGTTSTGHYENPNYNVKTWTTRNGLCEITSSTPTSVNWKCTIPADNVRCVWFDTACQADVACGGFSAAFNPEIEATFVWHGCVEGMQLFKEGNRKCVGDVVYECTENNIFEPVEDCSTWGAGASCKQDGQIWRGIAYCQNTCYWTAEMGEVTARQGQTRCLFRGTPVVGEPCGTGLTDSGFYVCKHTGEWEKIFDYNCWVECDYVNNEACSSFKDMPEGIYGPWIVYGGRCHSYGMWYAPLEGGKSGYDAGASAESLGYEYVPPKEVAPAPPNPSPMVHFGWVEEAWNNFVIGIGNWMCSAFGIWC